jgi:hypothetical protein
MIEQLPQDIMAKLEAAGWVWLSARTSPNGLQMHTLGRYPETGLGGALRRYAEQEERSADGWAWEAEQE